MSYKSENLHGRYSIHPKYYPTIDMSPSCVDFDFHRSIHRSIDLGGDIFLVHFLEKIGKNKKLP